MNTNRFLLDEKEMPRAWYNIVADMKNKPLPMLNPGTKKPITADELGGLFAKELVKQELSTDQRFFEIPDEVMDLYQTYRATPLQRARRLEKLLDTPAKIYYKNESLSPSGSHKANSAIPQAYYNKKQGIKRLTTETGAGQWGCALSFACKYFGIDLRVFMVRVSYDQKPYRKILMNTWGANVTPSPSNTTEIGRKILAERPNTGGSLGDAISEAVELAMKDPYTNYSLGSVLNHVVLHQTIIGEEAKLQMAKADVYPDVVIGCFGGGSNFSGISFPFLADNLTKGYKTRFIAVEPQSCPKLTRGKFHYDFGDSEGFTPLIPMFTLGHDFEPSAIHAGGLRYHGAGSIISQLLKDKLIEAMDIAQLETFEAGIMFARTEGTIPAPESTHAIAAAIREAKQAKIEGKEKVILFNLSGHGMIDCSAYEQYLSGNMHNFEIKDEDIKRNTDKLDNLA